MSKLALLTNRQRDVVRLISEGLSRKEVAKRLGLSPKTVDQHTFQTKKKLGAKNRAHLVRIWILELEGKKGR